MEIVYTILNVLVGLIRRYCTYGFPFLLLHVYLIALILYGTNRRIRKETEALIQWGPGRSSELKAKYDTRSTQILDEFIEESEKLGSQGFFVPITDFSGRTDSIVDEMLGELHDRINLLLLVGIAGTLFGVFEFAFQTYNLFMGENPLPDDMVQKLSQFLTGSMAKAFPVGFMGLIMMLGFQIWATKPERRLSSALADAIHRSLAHRIHVTISQTEIVRQSAGVIQEAMKPLKDLKDTLTQTIQPVVEEFGKQLRQSLDLVEGQFKQLSHATEGIQTIIGGVREGVSSLRAVANSLENLLKNLPEVLANTVNLQKQQETSLREFNKTLEVQFNRFEHLGLQFATTLESVKLLPGQLLLEMNNVSNRLYDESLKVWTGKSDIFVSNVSTEYANFINAIKKQFEGIAEALQEAGRKIQDLAIGADALLRKSFKEALEEVVTKIHEELKPLSQVYPKAAEDVQEFTKSLVQLLHQAHEIQNKLTSWLEDIKQAESNIHGLIGVLREAVVEVQQLKYPFDGKEIVGLLQRSHQELVSTKQTIMCLQGDINSFIRREKWYQNLYKKLSFIPGMKGR